MKYVLAKFQVTKQVTEDQWDRVSIDKIFNCTDTCIEIINWYDAFVGNEKSELKIKKIEIPE